MVLKADDREEVDALRAGDLGAVHLVDLKKNEYRDSELKDIYDAARIVQQMDNIHFFQRPMVARDIPDPAALDLNTVYACIKGTAKHIGTSFTEAEFVRPCLSMLHEVAGGEDAWRERPFVSNSNIAEDIKAEAFVTHLHTPHTTKALTQHVIIDHKTFKAEAHQ